MLSILNYNIIATQIADNELSYGCVINTLNPHSFITAEKDTVFKEALQSGEYLIPDGIGIVWAAKFLKGEKITKIAGADLHLHLLEELQKTGGRVFYLGASENTLSKIKERANKEYPNLEIHTYSPPYKAEFSEEDNQAMLTAINNVKPDILFVGMSAPKQEKWVHKHKHQLQVGKIGCIGAVFDFYAGTVKRSGQFWISLGLEWLPRLLREPRRLWRRTVVSTPLFILTVVREKIKTAI